MLPCTLGRSLWNTRIILGSGTAERILTTGTEWELSSFPCGPVHRLDDFASTMSTRLRLDNALSG